MLAGRYGMATIYTQVPRSTERQAAATALQEEDDKHLTWLAPQTKRLRHKPKTLARTPQPTQAEASPPADLPPAGSPFGSLAYGSATGFEVRPAIRVSGSEPLVYDWDLASGSEGNIVIEVTIDERGNIVQKTLIQSLSPRVDKKVMAALEDWHFLPALRDGVPIPSKQDVYYHFPVRR
jgi:periplasmic protein TonB